MARVISGVVKILTSKPIEARNLAESIQFFENIGVEAEHTDLAGLQSSMIRILAFGDRGSIAKIALACIAHLSKFTKFSEL